MIASAGTKIRAHGGIELALGSGNGPAATQANGRAIPRRRLGGPSATGDIPVIDSRMIRPAPIRPSERAAEGSERADRELNAAATKAPTSPKRAHSIDAFGSCAAF